MLVITRSLSLFVFILCIVPVKSQETISKTMIIAHRGASFDAPENTVASARLAWKQNADAVELDIHLSADNRIMVIHDEDTKRTTGVNCKIAFTNSDSLRILDAGSWKNELYAGEKIPFLEEMLETVPDGKKLVIEIKSDKKIVPYLKQVINNSGKREQCIIISFDFEALAAAKASMSSIPAYFLSSKIDLDTFENLADQLRYNQIDGLDLHYATISPELSDICKKKNIPLLSWTVDNADIAEKLIQLGVIGIATNRPQEMRNQLESLNLL